MAIKIKSKIDRSWLLLLYGFTIAILIIFAYSSWNADEFDINNTLGFIVLLLTLAFIYWLFFGTYYIIEGETFKFVSGPLKGRIDILKIKKLRVGKTQWVGLKPATGRHGISIYARKYGMLYITPQDNEKFVEELLKINNNIEVIYS